MKEMLEKAKSNSWSKKEQSTFIRMVEKFGKNYKLIGAKLPTKTNKQISSYGHRMYNMLVRNPKHVHSALKKKLKPQNKDYWTET